MTSQLTEEQLKQVLPAKLKKSINKELIDKVNQSITDPVLAEMLRDNIIGYVHVMQDGKFKIEDYLHAVKYVSYKLMGDTNVTAYTKTFPNRYQTLINKGMDSQAISKYVAAYNKNKLVNLIYEQTLIPTHILNADIYQKAINTQAELMVTARSEKVRSDAANSILNHLKAPEKKEIEINLGVKQGSALDELRATTQQLADQQRQIMEAGGMTAQQVAHQPIVATLEKGEDGVYEPDNN